VDVVYNHTQSEGNQNGPTLQAGELCRRPFYQQNGVEARVQDVTGLRNTDRGQTAAGCGV